MFTDILKYLDCWMVDQPKETSGKLMRHSKVPHKQNFGIPPISSLVAKLSFDSYYKSIAGSWQNPKQYYVALPNICVSLKVDTEHLK